MTMRKHKHTLSPVTALFENNRVRRVMHDGQRHYAAADIVRELADTAHPDEYLFDLKVREPALAGAFEQVSFPTKNGETERASCTSVRITRDAGLTSGCAGSARARS